MQSRIESRGWYELFPGHPAAWVFFAAMLVTVLVARPHPAPQLAVSSEIARPAEQTVDPRKRAASYAWLSRAAARAYESLAARLPCDQGFVRVAVEPGSFGEWLRHLPVRPAGTAVMSGARKPLIAGNDRTLAAVVDLQPGNSQLLTAANIALRLRAEFLWSAGKAQAARFRFTNGEPFAYARWEQGHRPVVSGRQVEWVRAVKPDDPRVAYAGYMETLFRYSSVYSLLRDTVAVTDDSVQPGDLFVVPGRPGHAVVVVDVETDAEGSVRVLLGQGGTLARTFHIVRSSAATPWFEVRAGSSVMVTGWGAVAMKQLRRWAE